MKKLIAPATIVIVTAAIAYAAAYHPKLFSILKTFGLLGAFAFFCYRILSGWLLINMNVSITPDRQRAPNHSDDYLVAKIILEKGKIDAARILKMELRLSPIDAVGPPTIIQDVTIHRLLRNEDGRIAWGTTNCVNNFLNLPPDERFEFAEYFRIPSGVPYRIELVVTGDRYRLRATHFIPRSIPSLSQWRASAITLPLEQVGIQKD